MQFKFAKTDKSINKVYSFLSLQEGWHYGEGTPPSISVVNKAYRLIERASLSLFRTDVYPGVDGEVQVSLYFRDHYLEFLIERDESVTFVHEVNGQEVDYRENQSFEDSMKLIVSHGRELWKNLLERSTKSITIIASSASQVWPSRIHQAEVSPFLQKNVLKRQASQFVSTSENITQRTLATRRSSGSSQNQIFHLDGDLTNSQAQPTIYAMAT